MGNERFLILGAGAVGSHLAAALLERRGPGAVVVADPDPAARRAWAGRGVAALLTPELAPPHKVERFAFADGDVVILAVKGAVAAAALEPVPAAVPVVALPNGMHDALAAGRPALSFGVVDFAASPGAPGAPVVTRAGGLVLDRRAAAARRLAAALAGSPVRPRLTDDIAGHRWSKLLFNAAFDPLATLMGTTFGGVFAHPAGRRALRRLLAEGIAVARAAGIRLHAVQGASPETLVRILGTPLLGRAAAFLAARRARAIASAWAADLARGGAAEIEHVNGFLIRRAEVLGVPTPTHHRAVRLVHQLGTGALDPAPEHAARLLEAPG